MDDNKNKRRPFSGCNDKDDASHLCNTEYGKMTDDDKENKVGTGQNGKDGSIDNQLVAIRIVAECYITGCFDKLLSIITDDYEHHSFWVLDPMRGKETVTPYYIGKGEAIRGSDDRIRARIVRISAEPKTVPVDKIIINGEMVRNSRVVIWADLGKACVLMEQETDGERVLGLAVPTVNDEGKVTRLLITDPALYNLVPLTE